MSTMKKVAVVGTSHIYQRPDNPNAVAFEELIQSLLEASHFGAIGEEMSIEALSEHGTATSICERIAGERGIRHLYCDPDWQTRLRHDIWQENQIRWTAHTERLSEQEIRERILASYDRREHYWLDRILELDCWPLLFICVADHVDSFAAKVRARGRSAKVLRFDWSPMTDK